MQLDAIPFEGLSSAAILDGRDQREVERDELQIGSSRVLVGRASRVLYVPDLRLQLIDGSCVPEESLVDGWDLAFEMRRDFQGKTTPYRDPFEAAESGEEVVILSNFYSRNFGHWTTEELVKVHLLERHGYRGKYIISGLPAFARDYLAMLAVPPDRLITRVTQPTVYRSAWYTTAIHDGRARRYPDVYLSLRDALVQASVPASVNGAERIWMHREAQVAHGRSLVNAAEVRELVERYGFATIDMATLPVMQQVHLSSRARTLAGGHGAGFAHALFMERSNAVIECFSPRFVNPSIIGLCHVMGHHYSMLVSGGHYDGYAHGEGVLVDLDHLELVLQHL